MNYVGMLAIAINLLNQKYQKVHSFLQGVAEISMSCKYIIKKIFKTKSKFWVKLAGKRNSASLI